MNNIDGLVYLLNQAGVALAEANQQIAALVEENAALRAAVAAQDPSGDAAPEADSPRP